MRIFSPWKQLTPLIKSNAHKKCGHESIEIMYHLKSMDYSTHKIINLVNPALGIVYTWKMQTFAPQDKLMPLIRSWRITTKKFGLKHIEIMYHPKSMDYNTHKMVIWSFPLRASFELENVDICPSGPFHTINMFLIYNHSKIKPKNRWDRVSLKIHGL